ncbi:MAG TPA: Wzz/FepE/Etk N-terminal domain-containing protein [Bacillota bacterium]|jgi:capsular polysaccharide biosynthesis protein|nr:Wzz/FepE/Etk N-terminal domain-containing protein [Bacillota bacterium]
MGCKTLEQELDLRDLWHMVVNRWQFIVVIPLVAMLISAVVSIFFITPQYQSSATLLVLKQQPEQSLQYSDLQISRQLVQTYREIARSRRVLDSVIDNLKLDYSYGQLREKVEVTSVRDTEVIHITVTDPNPRLARRIANQVADSFKAQTEEIMQLESVTILDYAVIPSRPVSPRIPLNIAIALVVGLMVAAGLVFLLEYLDNTVKTPEDVQEYLGLPVLGIIPYVEEE